MIRAKMWKIGIIYVSMTMSAFQVPAQREVRGATDSIQLIHDSDPVMEEVTFKERCFAWLACRENTKDQAAPGWCGQQWLQPDEFNCLLLLV
jgi:hypothetical protein